MSIAPVSLGTVSDVLGPTNVVVPPVDYTSRDYTSLVNDMLNLIPSYLPEWTDRSAGDFGVVLLELFAYVGDILNFYTDRIANEAFISTAQQRQSVLNLAALLDYTPHGNVAATTFPSTQVPNGGLQFTVSQPCPTPVLVPQYTQVATLLIGQPIIFETMQDLWIYGDGIVNAVSGTGTGQVNQQLFLGDTSGTVPWPTYVYNGGVNLVVVVNGIQWTLAPGNSFVGQAATATMYTVIHFNTVLFGGGTAQSPGALPPSGATILIYYSTTNLTPGSPVTNPPTASPQYTANVMATHGQSILGEGIGISDGTPNQQFTLFNTPVVDSSVLVFVDEGGGPQPWAYKQRIIDAFSSEAAFTYSVDANSVVTVIFGDNLSGRIPAPGSVITANYMIGGGAIGNVGPNSLTQLQSSIPQVMSVTNPIATSGGADAETIDHIRVHAPLSITAINRAVTLDDYAALTLNIPSVAKAAAISTAYNAVNLYIHPAGSFISDIPTLTNRVNTLAQAITNSAYTGYLDDRKMVGTSVVVLPPQYNKNNVLQTGYVPVNVTVSVQVLPQYHTSVVQNAVQAAIQNLFLFSVVDFGSRITLSSVYHAIMEVEGVDYVNVNVLARQEVTQVAADVICAAYEIPQVNPLGIVVNASGGVMY